MFTLYIHPPAFGLPSHDPHSLAALAYCTLVLPSSALTTTSQPISNTSLALPYLLDSSSSGQAISGFQPIVSYLSSLSPDWDLDAELGALGRADTTAFSTHIQTTLGPLLDLSFFVSSANYTDLTRPRLSASLPFPLAYVTPAALRAAAKRRCAHLDLLALDVDQDVAAVELEGEGVIPPSLRVQKVPSVKSVLGKNPELRRGVRLHALGVAALGPLQDLLIEGQRAGSAFLLAGLRPSSLDCWAWGFVALAGVKGLQRNWLHLCVMGKEFESLQRWAEDLKQTCFGAAELQLASKVDVGIVDGGVVAREFIREISSGLGVTGSVYVPAKSIKNGKVERPAEEAKNTQMDVLKIGSVAVAAVGVLFGLSALRPDTSARDDDEDKADGGLKQFGEAGAALAVLSGGDGW